MKLPVYLVYTLLTPYANKTHYMGKMVNIPWKYDCIPRVGEKISFVIDYCNNKIHYVKDVQFVEYCISGLNKKEKFVKIYVGDIDPEETLHPTNEDSKDRGFVVRKGDI
jgi:hypothetical protein